jgi:acyl carrier protein
MCHDTANHPAATAPSVTSSAEAFVDDVCLKNELSDLKAQLQLLISLSGSSAQPNQLGTANPVPPQVSSQVDLKTDLSSIQDVISELISIEAAGLQVQLDQPFMAQGITSAQAVRIALAISRKLGATISPVDMFNHPTVIALASHVTAPLEIIQIPLAESLSVSSLSRSEQAVATVTCRHPIRCTWQHVPVAFDGAR